MNIRFTSALAGFVMLSACAGQPATAPPAVAAAPALPVSDNPFYARSTLPYQLPPFDRIKDEHYRPAYEMGMAENLREIEMIAANQQPASFENTIVAMERAGLLLTRVNTVLGALTSAHTNDEIKKIEVEYSPKLSAHSDKIYLNAALYARVKSLYDTRDALNAPC